jgi:ribosomal-protein-alanine acetyltransferase
MIIRTAMPADVPALTRLELVFPARQRWSETSWLEEISGEDRLVEVAVTAVEGVIACASWRHAGGTADLDRIVVAGKHRRLGIAGRLLRRGIAWAAEQRVGSVLLEVASYNIAAIGFYAANGFVPVNRRGNYYGRGVDAVVMEKKMKMEESQ